MKTKQCNECGEIKEVSPEFFYRKKCLKDGFLNICKVCEGKKAAKRYSDNKKKYSKKSLEYYYANKEDVRVKQKEYRLKTKQKWIDHSKTYYKKNAREMRLKNSLYARSKRLVVRSNKEFSLIENIVFENIVKKTCRKCKQSKPANLDYWHKDSDYKDGLKTTCKVCCNNVTEKYYRKKKNKKKYDKYNGAKIVIDKVEVGGLIDIMMCMVTTKRG